jgi:adenylate cyclase
MLGPMHDEHVKGSEHRLWELVAERAKPGADVSRIDERIWDLFGEDWAVMFTDLTGFSRRVAEFGIIHFLQVIYEQNRVLLPIISDHDGILIKQEADSFLVVFRRPRSAVTCAVDMQRACQKASRGRRPEDQLLLCVGIGYGRILRIADVDVFGSEVNAASKLGEDMAKSDQILVTDAVREAAGVLEGMSYEPLDASIPGSSHAWRVVYPRDAI